MFDFDKSIKIHETIFEYHLSNNDKQTLFSDIQISSYDYSNIFIPFANPNFICNKFYSLNEIATIGQISFNSTTKPIFSLPLYFLSSRENNLFSRNRTIFCINKCPIFFSDLKEIVPFLLNTSLDIIEYVPLSHRKSK